MKVRRRKKLDIPLDYPLPNLYYFSGNLLRKISRQLTRLTSVLNEAGFQECHFPFLVPRSVLLNYKDLVSLNNYIIANADFGHTDPKATIPIGGMVRIQASQENTLIEFTEH